MGSNIYCHPLPFMLSQVLFAASVSGSGDTVAAVMGNRHVSLTAKDHVVRVVRLDRPKYLCVVMGLFGPGLPMIKKVFMLSDQCEVDFDFLELFFLILLFFTTNRRPVAFGETTCRPGDDTQKHVFLEELTGPRNTIICVFSPGLPMIKFFMLISPCENARSIKNDFYYCFSLLCSFVLICCFVLGVFGGFFFGGGGGVSVSRFLFWCFFCIFGNVSLGLFSKYTNIYLKETYIHVEILTILLWQSFLFIIVYHTRTYVMIM